MARPIESSFLVEGRVAVVTGSASGIGREAALVLSAAGAKVVLADIDRKGLDETAELVAAQTGTCLTVEMDVSQRSTVFALADKAVAAYGRLDVWANIAGVVAREAIYNVSEEALTHQININLKGLFWGCIAAVEKMKNNGGGSIINMSSTAADLSAAGRSVYPVYSMTKAAVNACTRNCAMEFGKYGVRVNGIAPGFTDTPMTSAAMEPDPQKRQAIKEAAAKASPLGIFGEPRDIGLAVLYLASDAARFITGQTIRVNGGTSMVF